MPANVERCAYSQNGEDGIIDHLTQLMGIDGGVFAEIGAANGAQNCTRELAELGWSGVWVEGDPELAARARDLRLGGRVTVVEAMVDPGNVVDLLREAGTPDQPDVMSVDIDCANFWITEALLASFSPRLLIVEINGEHRDTWIQRPDASELWDGSWNYGASLRSYCRLTSARGYTLVGCDSQGVNAFFVRSDLVCAGMEPGDWRTHYVPPSHRPGTLGHPRLSAERPALDHPIPEAGLASVRFGDFEIVGSATRRPGETISVLMTITNGSHDPLCPTGRFPVRLSYQLYGEDDRRSGDEEPPRSFLASVVIPGTRSTAAVEVRLPDRTGVWGIVPTLVQEGVAWWQPDPTERVEVNVVPDGR